MIRSRLDKSQLTAVIAALLLAVFFACTPVVDPTASQAPVAVQQIEPAAAAVTPTLTATPSSTPIATALPSVTPLPTERPAPTPLLSATPTRTPAPTIVPAATVTQVPSPTPTATPAATASPTPTLTPTPIPPTPVPPSIEFKTVWDFPDRIEFEGEFEHFREIKHAELRIQYNKVRTCTSQEFMSVRISPPDVSGDPFKWTWEMKKTGSIPPGTVVEFTWALEDVEGEVFWFEWQEIAWDDPRFAWQSFEKDNITLEWYSGGNGFGQELYERVISDIGRLQIDATITTPIKALIYEDSAALQGAVLHAQAWTAGLAFTNQNIILIAIDPETTETQASGLTHEIAHLLVAQESHGCIGDIPSWLSEGMATYAEGTIRDSFQTTIDTALGDGSLITVRSLTSSFPADHTGASQSYAQSVSLVKYLVETHGWGNMKDLLQIFKDGSSYDGALTTVYGFDQAGLDSAWRTWLAGQ